MGLSNRHLVLSPPIVYQDSIKYNSCQEVPVDSTEVKRPSEKLYRPGRLKGRSEAHCLMLLRSFEVENR